MRTNAGASRTRTQWLAVAAAVLCGIAVASNVGKVSIMIAPLRDAFGLSLLEAGWLSSAINLLAMSSAVIFGFSADRIGGLRLCLAGIGFGLVGIFVGPVLLAVGYTLLDSWVGDGTSPRPPTEVA